MSKSEHKRICVQSKCAVRDELRSQIEAKDKEIGLANNLKMKNFELAEKLLKDNALLRELLEETRLINLDYWEKANFGSRGEG